MSKYRRVTYEDRCQIYALSKGGTSQECIASVLGVSQSTVSRELRRNRGQRGYRFKQAEAKAQARQTIRSTPRKLTVPVRGKIEAKLRQMRWSPEQISGWLSDQGIKLSHERIYQMIWQDKRDGGNLWHSLRRRGKRYNKRAGKNAGRGLIPNRIDISELGFSHSRGVSKCILHALPDMARNFYAVSAWPRHERNLVMPDFATYSRDCIAECQDRFWIPCGGSRFEFL